MVKAPKGLKAEKEIVAVDHKEASRLNIPTAEYQAVMRAEEMSPVRVAYERRNRDLDPQLVWRGKDEQDASDLIVNAPPLYIQEKIKPQVLIEDLRRYSSEKRCTSQMDLYADFNGFPKGADRTEFYQHEGRWQNRLILGDSLQVMTSLAEREGLRGKVQCIYLDPPYGIRFNSNFQWSTTSREVKDGNPDHITREPEQVKAFRDTWREGIHSYLTYLRDRLTAARELLTESGSIFVQIGDENVHRVRALMDEIFVPNNFVSEIVVVKTAGLSAADRLASSCDIILWYARKVEAIKYRQLAIKRRIDANENFYRLFRDSTGRDYFSENDVFRAGLKLDDVRRFGIDNLTKPGPGSKFDFPYQGQRFSPGNRWWGTTQGGMSRAERANRLWISGKTLRFVRYVEDYPVRALNNVWADMGTGGFLEEKVYVVQTRQSIVERCILMATDPGDLVADPTCGSGTTAYVSEQWGRRWITIDTSRVALVLARARIMGARFPYYQLSDSPEGQQRQAELQGRAPSFAPTHGSIRQGFVYERVPHITLKSIANNSEIDVIWEENQKTLESLRDALNDAIGKSWKEWEIPRDAESGWSQEAKKLHEAWWSAWISRQAAIDSSIASKAELEFLYDKPYEDKNKVRVAGPFTVESLSPHRVLALDENDRLVGASTAVGGLGIDADEYDPANFVQTIIENLRTSGVQQAHKEDKITFTSIELWPGQMICAQGRYADENATERRAGIMIGPEFGTVTREDLVQAAREGR